MITEIGIAVSYIIGPLYSNLPRRRVDDFGMELEKLLRLKIAPYWNPVQPFSGLHQRCLRVNGPYADPIIYFAATKSGINYTEIQNLFPKEEMKVWVDPGEVSYLIGDQLNSEIKYLLKRSYSIPDSSLSPTNASSSGSETLNANFRNCSPYFTVSSFAKTKFGSTKLKHHTLSPTAPEADRPNSLTFAAENATTSASLPYSTDSSSSSGIMSPMTPADTTINIPCYLPWGLDGAAGGPGSLLTINIPNYSTREASSEIGSLNSELNSPVHGY